MTRADIDTKKLADMKRSRKAREKAAAPKANGAGNPDAKVAAEITRLAKLSQLEYDRQRKEAAKQLRVRATTVDDMVQAERTKLGLNEDGSRQGHAVSFIEPEPWPQAVDGAALLGDVADAIGRHVIMPDHCRDACALWAAHTYLTDAFMHSPRLAVLSPTKGCGKTLLLDVLARLALRPLPTANVTSAAVFRVVETHQPTLLIDEGDTFLRDNDELRGVLNSGHRKGGSILRTVGEEHEPRAFSTYSPCAIALIGTLPDTLHDRAVAVELKRRLLSESVQPFRDDRAGHLDVLARRLMRWTADHAGPIGDADPVMPDGVFNRQADNWRPLLAIADAAGGAWPERARAAAAMATNAASGDEARLVVLLGDIRATFTALDGDRAPSTELAAALASIEGRPWGEYGRAGKPLTANQLARLLKPLGIAPQLLRTADSIARGYQSGQFTEAFERYLSPDQGGSDRYTATNADVIGTSGTFQTVTPKSDVTVGKCKKPNNGGPCYDVTDEKGGTGEETPSKRWGGDT